jgi:hypothetical protein
MDMKIIVLVHRYPVCLNRSAVRLFSHVQCVFNKWQRAH